MDADEKSFKLTLGKGKHMQSICSKGEAFSRPHVLLIYRTMLPSIRLCGHLQFEYLASNGLIEYTACQETKLSNAIFNWADIVVLGRLDNWYEYQLAQMLHKTGKYLIYCIDDDLLNIPSDISSAAYYRQKSVLSCIRRMIDMSNAILSPSPLLLKKYATDGRIGMQIEEPAIDPVSYHPHDLQKPVKIGFAGSIDRTADVETLLKKVLIQIKREYGNRVQFEFFGTAVSFSKELDAICIPYCDSYDEYRKKLNALQWDIGLAPMPDTPFHACKHYNKFTEYGAAGAVGVFSDVEPYSRLKNCPCTGKFCNNQRTAWYDAIKFLLDDPYQREKMREKTIGLMLENYSLKHTSLIFYQNNIKLWKEDRVSEIKRYYIKPTLMTAEIHRIWGFIKINKFHSVIKVVRRLYSRKQV